jgi:hypothetical protein
VFASFDIFRVDADGNAAWVMSVPSLQMACNLVEQLSVSRQGEYFLFGQQTGHGISVGVVTETFNSVSRVGTYAVQ